MTEEMIALENKIDKLIEESDLTPVEIFGVLEAIKLKIHARMIFDVNKMKDEQNENNK